jgi:GT2 family glycosyltransferase
MNIAVVILNGMVTIIRAILPSIIAFSPEATIYIADNASTDESIAFVQQHYPAIKIIKIMLILAQGYNEALKHIDAEIYALVNSDIEVTANWLLPVIETFKNHKQRLYSLKY